MGMTKNVEIHKAHQNERKSKRNFETLLDKLNMRMAFPWADNDYGIDGQVELTSPIKDSESFKPDSKFFLIQLKSTESLRVIKTQVSFPVPVKKVIQWYSANLPVMLVINDLSSKSFYYQWIDEKLISNLENTKPNWVIQTDITLKIPIGNNFNSDISNALRDYVISWKIPSRKVIEPGLYFEFKDKCVANIDEYAEINQPFAFESIGSSIEKFKIQIDQSIYRIAITGPSRVGKSSLINALLRRKDISPTGIFQTTGVPIQILPGKTESVVINFRDGKSISSKFSKKIIEEYASQEKNEDNKKNVALLSIHLINKQLERGVSFFDIPGLDDPDDNVYNYTWNTVTKSNAILYLVDASPFENGGYIFRSEYKKHILELQSLDKIFLVFTKINALTQGKLEVLEERVKLDLKKYGLLEKVSERIYFISAEESLSARMGTKNGFDSVQKLEDDIWTYLLRENKIGLVRLSYLNNEIINSINDFEGVLNAGLLDNKDRKRLIEAIEVVKTKIPDLWKLHSGREAEMKKGISTSLENKKHNLLIELETYLKSIHPNKDLPEKKALQNYLMQGGHKTLEQTNNEYAHQVNLLKDMIDLWIEDNLRQVREIVSGNSDQKIVDFSELEKIEPAQVDLSTSFGFGLLTGIIGFIINPPAAILAGVVGFFGNLWLSSAERRAKRIAKIMLGARKCYDDQFRKIDEAYLELINDHSKLVKDYASNKIGLFFKDLQNQMRGLRASLTEQEEIHYRTAFGKTKKLRDSIFKLNRDISSWCDSV
jgi:GTPase SAR1 family protein